ncbi:endonuclease/exonuclease/phosphatase superfamily protein [Fadolivirus algeromassiliense]|jgi:hypothetical protein|uniref:Endonuclease/exonuclease/phosphatase superfamily protein n=1 Tax=Fadolivirus FV1/VV64 TaxID=3070911 RepID=A0A7D3UVD7_9VIRU|nr:endonuclease/exonuclease/phosphatase superfamily protein [Fadolivirus algeromassiliense]QKF94109.1 endonuclease/exonuclease/phosphatase superfamily protein [Fadolivirus FV1/VV64]
MGGIISKKGDIKINDFSLVKIPKDCKLIKIATYNANLRNSVNSDLKIKQLITYLISEHKNIPIDIINLQGIYDISTLYVFIREFKKYCSKHKVEIYFAPKFDNVDITGNSSSGVISSQKLLDLALHSSGTSKSSGNTDNEGKKRKIIQNIIISRYPILSTIYGELDSQTDMDDILGIQTVIGANILIDKKIISVYNTNLIKDIKSANIINTDVRNCELDTLFTIVEKNKNALLENRYKKYKLSDIHFIVGTLNISESIGNTINDEYTSLIEKKQCIDIYRYLTNDIGHTTSYMERLNYILLQLTSDIYQKTSPFYDLMKKIKTPEELMQLFYQRYGLHIMDCYVIKNDNTNNLIYYPIECIFMIKSKN